MSNPEGPVPDHFLRENKRVKARPKVIQLNKTEENVLECKKCGCQVFFIHMDDNDDISYFECGRDGCPEKVKFNI